MKKSAKIIKKKKQNKKISKFLYWTPRIISIIFILFLALFSLDVFEMNLGFWQTILGLFMHNLPSIILAIILIISWKREWLASITFILAGLGYILLLLINSKWEWYMLSWSLIIAVPAIIIGILFWMNWTRRR